MKKYTLARHLEDFWEWYNDAYQVLGKPPLSYNATTVEQIAWWTAYERWLNDRPLLIEEDDQARVEPHGSERLAE